MVFARDLDPDEHVYANPVSSFLQQVGKASGRLLSKAVKEIKHRIQTHQARRKHRPPTFVQLPPRHCERSGPSSELRDYNYPPVTDTSSCRGIRKPEFTNIYRHPEGNKSYESMAQINPLPRLYVTNPDVQRPRTAADNLSDSSSISVTRNKGHIQRPTSFKRSPRPIQPSRSNRPLADIPEEPISANFDCVDLPLSLEGTPFQRLHNIDELWFTASSSETPESASMYFSPYSNQGPVFTSSASLSSSQAACSKSQNDIIPLKNSQLDIDAPIRTLRSSRGRRLSFPPRIPSLYFRAGSPFADQNLPWNRLSNPESIGP